MSDTQKRPQGNPHQVGWFYRLMGLYNRQSHPYMADMAADEQIDQQNAQAYWDRMFRLGENRVEKYRIYDEMDNFDLVSAVLDVYAEESTQKDYDRGKSVWIESKSASMVKAGDECLQNCQVEDRITPLCRRMCKYGDGFQRLIYQTGKGVLAWRFAKTHTIHRVEDKYLRLVGFKEDGQKFRGSKRQVSWPWDYAHFRILGKDEESGHGTSILDAMFRPWRQMVLTEDGALMYRLRRAPDRNMVMVDCQGLEEHEVAAQVNSWRKKFRKFEFVDPTSPNYRKQYNPLTPLEDIFIPVYGDIKNSRIETLSGSGNVDELYDLNHYVDKFFGAAKAPKAYFGFEGELNAKATLSQQDIRFARTCKRIQKALIYGLRQTLDIHYTLLPTNPEDTTFKLDLPENQYVVQMSPIAYLDEWERLELVQLRYQIIESMSRLAMDMQLDARAWAAYILLNFAKLPEDLVLKLMSKTPEKAMPAAGGFESLAPFMGKSSDEINRMMADPEKRKQIMESGNGFYSVNPREEIAIATLMHNSPELRKLVGDIHEYHLDDLHERALLQVDPSTLPPIAHGVVLEDEYADDVNAKELHEDMLALRSGKLIVEG